MRLYIILILIGMTIISCSKDEDNLSSCDLKAVVSAKEYAKARTDSLKLWTLSLDHHCLKIEIGSAGCTGASWQPKLIDSGEILESYPPQRNLKLILDNEETCEAYLRKEYSFDVSNLRVDGDKVILNFTDNDARILYSF